MSWTSFTLGFTKSVKDDPHCTKCITVIKKANQMKSNAKYTEKFARIIVKDGNQDNQKRTKYLLESVKLMDAKGVSAQYLVTPGGFLYDSCLLDDWDGNHGWRSNDQDTQKLFKLGRKFLKENLSKEATNEIAKACRCLTIGIDLVCRNGLHAELVVLIDLKTGKKYWTGKSYPVSTQQNKLIRISNLETHFIHFSKNKTVCILGCHDLNMFSHRAISNQTKGSNRNIIANDFHKLFDKHQPEIVIQHPHTTDTSKIWNTAWSGLQKDHKYVSEWISGIAHYQRDSEKTREPIKKVLAQTRSRKSFDILPSQLVCVKKTDFFDLKRSKNDTLYMRTWKGRI